MIASEASIHRLFRWVIFLHGMFSFVAACFLVDVFTDSRRMQAAGTFAFGLGYLLLTICLARHFSLPLFPSRPSRH